MLDVLSALEIGRLAPQFRVLRSIDVEELAVSQVAEGPGAGWIGALGYHGGDPFVLTGFDAGRRPWVHQYLCSTWIRREWHNEQETPLKAARTLHLR